MKGYKGMSKDMTCRGMKYEIGKTYHTSGQINACHNGMHFCKRLQDVFEFYPDEDGNRFFEIEADGVIDTDGTKSAAETRKAKWMPLPDASDNNVGEKEEK